MPKCGQSAELAPNTFAIKSWMFGLHKRFGGKHRRFANYFVEDIWLQPQAIIKLILDSCGTSWSNFIKKLQPAPPSLLSPPPPSGSPLQPPPPSPQSGLLSACPPALERELCPGEDSTGRRRRGGKPASHSASLLWVGRRVHSL